VIKRGEYADAASAEPSTRAVAPDRTSLRCAMLSTGPLTTDDLDEIGCSFGTQPPDMATELVDAVDQGRLADRADTGYALILAAEITERDGDLPAAEVLARRAVAAYRTYGNPRYGFPRAFHAGLLMRLGHEDQAMAELTALRPLLLSSVDAVSYVCGTLEEWGRAELAEQWVTEAVRTALEPRETRTGQLVSEQNPMVTLALVQYRHRLRGELGLPHDEFDQLADYLRDAISDALDGDTRNDIAITALLFWPQQEFSRLLLRWPTLAEDYGHTWNEYRASVQRVMLEWSDSGAPRLGLLAGVADELADFAEHFNGDPADPLVRQRYSEYLQERAEVIVWPPGRNHPCWCGSALKYKKCCLLRTRT
jgi:SEC-C motif